MQDFQEAYRQKLIKTLGSIIRKHRISQRKSMYKISAECSMSKSTWREAEYGICKDMNLSTFWKISEGLNIAPDVLLKELREKLGKEFTLTDFD